MKTLTRFQLYLMILLWVPVWIWSVWAPTDRLTWWLEVLPLMLAVPILLLTHKSFPLPRSAYFWIFVAGNFLMVGGHYTYAEVPIGFWFQEWFHLERNHYDRVGHFVQGVVPGIVASEVLRRHLKMNRTWTFVFTLCIVLSISVIYELMEWWAALIFARGATDFLATQGDVWDAHWDMLLAGLGGILSQLLTPFYLRPKAYPWTSRGPH